MASPAAIANVPGAAYIRPELDLLRGNATAVMNEHVNDAGLCAICGAAWPCERVLLAEHNLVLL